MDTTLRLQEIIADIAVIRGSNIPGDEGEIYCSKIDNSYIGRVGQENVLAFFLEYEITEQVQGPSGEGSAACIGFSPATQQWFGWSHRAFSGFGVGSEVRKGSCAYQADSKENYAQECLDFWADEDDYENLIYQFTEKGVWIKGTYRSELGESPRGTEFADFCPFPEKWGRGGWTAKTLEDAKEMAIAFAEAVSS